MMNAVTMEDKHEMITYDNFHAEVFVLRPNSPFKSHSDPRVRLCFTNGGVVEFRAFLLYMTEAIMFLDGQQGANV